MRNYDFLFILVCFFVLRIVLFSATYADSICLIGILAYKIGKQVLEIKKVSNDVDDKIKANEIANNQKLQTLAEEIVKVRNSTEGIKAAVNLAKR